ncbi:MAG TPA: hypothetical protein VIY48_10405 [Candidatus Paceibacterota bacterium]
MIVNNAFVMSASIEVLTVLARAIGMNQTQIEHATKKGKLAQHVGTKLQNSVTLGTAYAEGTLDHVVFASAALNDMMQKQADVDAAASQAKTEEPQAQASAEASKPGKKNVKSAKTWLRELLSAEGAEYTLAELVALTGKTEVNIRTMLSDLRSAKYAGKQGVFNTKSVRKDGKVFYSAA